MTPGSLLMKSKRSTSHALAPGSLPTPSGTVLKESPPRVTGKKGSPTHPGNSRFGNIARSDGSVSTGRRRSASGGTQLDGAASILRAGDLRSSPLAFGQPEMGPTENKESSGQPAGGGAAIQDAKVPNVLGLGLGSDWDSIAGISKDKGKVKEAMSPPSPMRGGERTTLGVMGVSR